MVKKIVVVTTSPIPYGNNITDGPGYRAWNLFQELARRNEITILSLYESFHLGLKKEYELFEGNMQIRCVNHKLSKVAKQIQQEKPDVLYVPWSSTPFLSHLSKKVPTIVDYVGVGLLEEYVKGGYVPVTLLQLKLKSFWMGDFLMTAGQRERFYLLGLLVASKKLCQRIRKSSGPLIHVIPMSPPTTPPRLEQKIIDRKQGELILLVAGAFLPWYDYSTFFKALEILCRKGRTNFKVIVMGGNPRNPKFEKEIQRMMGTSTIQGKLIYTGLVPFKQRANYYLSADVAVNIPPPTIEDELSVRTRVVDYLWAQLPIITPARDEYSQIAVNNGAGFAYEAGNPSSLAQTIETVITKPEKLEQAKDKTKRVLDTYFVLKDHIAPLESFIKNPNVDSLRRPPRSVRFELFLWMRDILRLFK